jgi:hypothetical protein
MKWMKLFEGFDTDEYYQKINRVDFDVYQWGEDNSLNNRVDFDRKIMTNIGSLLNNGFKFDMSGSAQKSLYRYIGGDDLIYVMTITGIRESILIIQLEDEWFLVRQVKDIMSDQYNRIGIDTESYNYYRCDQVEGLKKLLKDKGIIK